MTRRRVRGEKQRQLLDDSEWDDREFLKDGFSLYLLTTFNGRKVREAVPTPVIESLGRCLSPREAEALRLLGEDRSFAEVGALMGVTKATAQTLHRRAVGKVMELVRSGELAEAIRKARKAYPQLRRVLRLVEAFQAQPKKPRKSRE